MKNLRKNCRACLQMITKRPVLLSKSNYEFIEKSLFLNKVPREHSGIKLPQNVCFDCYSKLIEFQRFYVLLNETEEFLSNEIKALEFVPTDLVITGPSIDSEQLLKPPDAPNVPNQQQQDEQKDEIMEYDSRDNEYNDDDVDVEEQIECENGDELNDSISKYILRLPSIKKLDEKDIASPSAPLNVELIRKYFDCRFCDKRYKKLSELRSHEYVHSEARPHICDICGKGFRQKNVLVTHMTLHTGKPIECKLCHKKFARKSQLIVHDRMHNNDKPFLCDYPGCEAVYRERQYLLSHKETHSGIRKYPCMQCPKAFFNRLHMLAHEERVHNQCYSCNLCYKQFKKSSMIRQHMSIEHDVTVLDLKNYKKSINKHDDIHM